MMPKGHRAALAAFAMAQSACTTETVVEQRTERQTALDHGRMLMSSPSASPSSQNPFSCATCHFATSADADGRILPGAVLAGATERPAFWGGTENDLLRSINYCRTYFMGAQNPWTIEDEQAKVFYLFLTSLPAEAPEAQPMTVEPIAYDLPPGDEARGSEVYDAACRSCHGAAHTGEGRLTERATILPEESLEYFETLGFDATQARVTFVEKVRHGPFLGLYGNMPLFPLEALSDDDLGALLAFLDLYP